MQITSRLSAGLVTADITADAASDVGSVRAINEDSYLIASNIFLVADGMGGHNAGDQASSAVRETFAKAATGDGPTTTSAVLDAISSANAAVRMIAGDGRLSGTTLAGLAMVESGAGLHWMVFNVGDSRIYQWDGRALTQLSVDHSAVQELVDGGVITAIDAVTHPDRNVITRAIGATEVVDADVWLLPVHGSQSFLLCSDGLTKEIDDTTIAAILAGSGAEQTADALVAAALEAGGADNVTAVIVRSTARDGREFIEHTGDRRDASAQLEDTRPRL